MSGPESETPDLQIFVAAINDDPADSLSVFFNALKSLGYAIRIGEVESQGGYSSRQVLSSSAEARKNAYDLSIAFMKTLPGRAIVALSEGEYGEFMVPDSHQMMHQKTMRPPQLEETLMRRMFLRSYDRSMEKRDKDKEMSLEEFLAHEATRRDADRMGKRYYDHLKALGVDPITDSELLDLAIDGLAFTANLIRITQV